MRRLPQRIAVPESAQAVADEVQRFLRAADVRNELPTPKDRILECAQLVSIGEIGLNEYEQTFLSTASIGLRRILSKIQGLLDVRSKTIYVDRHLQQNRKNFVTYHEVTHKILPWQRLIYAEDDELNLRDLCEDKFESEANYGSAEIIFQGDRFEREARDYQVSAASVVHLAQAYAASYHSTFRRFVERNHRPCLLLILRRGQADDMQPYLLCYKIPSSSFLAEFGNPLSDYSADPVLFPFITTGLTGEIALNDTRGFSRTCNVEVFDNQYNLFTLVYPKSMTAGRRIVLFSSARQGRDSRS